MESHPDTSELIEITIELPSVLLAAAQEATGKGVAETITEGLEKIVSEASPKPR